MSIRTDVGYADELDAGDALAHLRERFVFADEELVYMDGNSLGRLPRASVEVVQDVVKRQWGERLIRGWNESWFEMPQRIGAKVARLIGAEPDEVIMADSTSGNLVKVGVAGLGMRGGRWQVVTETMKFSSGLYIFQGIVDVFG